jgi:hypothetical protein
MKAPDTGRVFGYNSRAHEVFRIGTYLKNSCVGLEKLYSPRSPASGGSYQGGFLVPTAGEKPNFLTNANN